MAGSSQLALQSVFSTLHIRLFFPKVHEKDGGGLEDDSLVGFELGEGYKMRV